MTFGMLGLISILLNGCAFNKQEVKNTPLGLKDYIEISSGSVITGVDLPTDEKKKHNVVTEKNGMWISLEGFNRVQK